jgi:hypothetical protein
MRFIPWSLGESYFGLLNAYKSSSPMHWEGLLVLEIPGKNEVHIE